MNYTHKHYRWLNIYSYNIIVYTYYWYTHQFTSIISQVCLLTARKQWKRMTCADLLVLDVSKMLHVHMLYGFNNVHISYCNYVCMYVYTHMHVYIYIYIYTYTCACIRVCISLSLYIYIYTYTYIIFQACVYSWSNTLDEYNANMHKQTHYIYIYIYIHTSYYYNMAYM